MSDFLGVCFNEEARLLVSSVLEYLSVWFWKLNISGLISGLLAHPPHDFHYCSNLVLPIAQTLRHRTFPKSLGYVTQRSTLFNEVNSVQSCEVPDICVCYHYACSAVLLGFLVIFCGEQCWWPSMVISDICYLEFMPNLNTTVVPSPERSRPYLIYPAVKQVGACSFSMLWIKS